MSQASRKAVARLTRFFDRNGYVRWQDPYRVDPDGVRNDRKGDEIRFVADSPEELLTIRRLLEEIGVRPARPWLHGCQIRQPVYGRDDVRRLLALMGRDAAEPRSRRSSPRSRAH